MSSPGGKRIVAVPNDDRLKELDVDHHHCVNSLEKPVVKSMAKCGNRADNKLQAEKVAALEDEVDFLSAKLKEEEQARKAAQREAHTLRKELDQHRAHEQEHRASGDEVMGLRAQVSDLMELVKDREEALANARARLAALRPGTSVSEKAAREDQEDAATAREKEAAAAAPATSETQHLRRLQTDNRLLNEELDRMCAELTRLQHRLARGEFNSSSCRVVRTLAAPPCSKCLHLDALRTKVAALEAAHAEAMGRSKQNEQPQEEEEGCDSSAALEYGLKISELHKVIAEKEKYISRLNEQAKAQIQEYKEVAKALFGFSLSKYKTLDSKTVAGQYQVKSLFASSSADVLLVQAQDGGKQVDILSSNYLTRIKDIADRCFSQAHLFPPLPALMASITCEHFERLVNN